MARDNGTRSILPEVLRHLDGDAARFAETVFAAGALDGAEHLDPKAVAEDVRGALKFIADKKPERHKVQIRPSASGTVTLVEILNDDMPFLVDSVMAEIQQRGHKVLAVVHPLFKTQRTKGGRLRAILGAADANWSDGQQESLIAVYLAAMSPVAATDLGRALSDILAEVRLAVSDWHPMIRRAERTIHDLSRAPIAPLSRIAAVDVMKWLLDGHFTFLGMQEMRFAADDHLHAVDGTALGLLKSPDIPVLRRGTEEIAVKRVSDGAAAPLVIAKASAVARVHRRVLMDYIAVNTYETDATPTGELRIVGLFTSKAYTQTARENPALKGKIDTVLEASGYPPQSHAGKALVNILDTFPRDELFQIEADDLAAWSQGILDLDLRPRVRAFARPDRFGRYVSFLIYAPRDRWTTQVREKIGARLAAACAGAVTTFQPHFFEGPLLRAQFIVSTPSGTLPFLDLDRLEAEITALMRTWDDGFQDAVSSFAGDAAHIAEAYGKAFPLAYTETFSPDRAVEDIRRLERLIRGREPIAIDFFRDPVAPPARIHAAVSRVGEPIRLSERVPLLENLGFSVIDERSFTVRPDGLGDGATIALHHMALETADAAPLDLSQIDTRLEETYRAVSRGEADNDGFNRLVIAAGATWREAALMRAYGAYIRQLNQPFGLRYLADTLLRHAGVTRDLVELFHVRFDPERTRKAGEAEAIKARITAALAHVPSLDEDRILRIYLNLIDATLRTNHYQSDAEDGVAPIVLKFDSRAIEAAPQPKPYREIWVYSPRVEGVHLRFAPIARGGIRWSDRAQDFRTEVLGLVKAQLVKNAVIVPSGAKGGFLPKQLPRGGNRDDIAKEGIAAYKIFINALLSITDNIVGDKVVPPPRVVRHDGDDPYLVVAADKGTATFSDTANELSRERQHWLGDAFASGGSVGYDHKKMAITARGGWECVKRHFRELGIDIQSTPFRVIGVGDMSGDVFGNGMLLSRAIKLVAAFDHRDIFIDPDPDPAQGFAERERLFKLPRSSWADYDMSKISVGGGVFSRTAKSLTLSPQIKALLRLDNETVTPVEVMRAILRLDADLLWLGGIGTYVRASTETDEQVGDRSNDAIRVTAAELGAKVVGEGANLGLTQRGRVELAQRGVRLNTDFIDNSAGVNSSDLEVNIKIALGRATQSGKLAGDARQAFLATMTADVASSCLVNNHQQSLALSLAEARSHADTRAYARLMRALEKRRLLDRRLEALPNDTDLVQRARAGKPLTRPELAVLLSYSKIALTEDLLASPVPDSAQAAHLLTRYMPPALRQRYAADVEAHRLKREIIATALTNAVINRAGPAFVTGLADESGRPAADVAMAYLAAETIYDLDQLYARIDSLDATAQGKLQNDLYLDVQTLLRSTMRDLLRDGRVLTAYKDVVAAHAAARKVLATDIGALLPPATASSLVATAEALAGKGVPSALASDMARMPVLADLPAIVRLAESARVSEVAAARALFAIGADLKLAALRAKAAALPTEDEYDALAVGQALQQIAMAQAGFAKSSLRAGASRDPDNWDALYRERTAPVRALFDQVAAGDTVTVARLVVAATRLRDLADAMA